MKEIFVALTISFLAVTHLTACNSSSTGNSHSQGGIDSMWDGSHALKLSNELETYRSECDDCPSSMGILVVRDFKTNRMKTCGGDMVAIGEFATARHCLTEELLVKGALCENQAYVIFPGNREHPTELVNCLEVVDFKKAIPNYSLKNPQPDWAILRLRPTRRDRSSTTINSGIPDRTKLSVYKPIIDIENKAIHVKKLGCEAIQNSLWLPSYLNDTRPLSLVKCDGFLYGGFSGSAVYNQQSEVMGFLSHILDEKPTNVQQGPYLNTVLASQWGVANNLSCILPDSEDELLGDLQIESELPPLDENGDIDEVALEEIENKKKDIRQQVKNHKKNCEFRPKRQIRNRFKIVNQALQKYKPVLMADFENWLATNDTQVRWKKTDFSELGPLPKSYKKHVKQKRTEGYLRDNESGNKIFKGKEADLITQFILPYHPECFIKRKKLTQIPVVRFKIVFDQFKNVHVEHRIEAAQAVMNKRGRGNQVRVQYGKTQRLSPPEKTSQKGTVILSSYASLVTKLNKCK